MGQDKALLSYKDNVWIFEQAKNIRDSKTVEHLWIVCQPLKKEAYQKALQVLNEAQFQIHFVVNPDPLSKPSDSIRCALKEMNSSAGSFVSPIDVPLKSSVMVSLASNETSKVIRPTYQGRPGHPVWIAGNLLSEFSGAATRLDDFLRNHISEECNREVSHAEILLNLNTPEAWDQFLKSN